jgi:hypothetical protein
LVYFDYDYFFSNPRQLAGQHPDARPDFNDAEILCAEGNPRADRRVNKKILPQRFCERKAVAGEQFFDDFR